MASTDNQQTWIPYVPTKDCSMGLCSVYCPQWCYVVFPPPPPVEFSDEDSSLTFSPLVIAIIGILASAFLLICYYTILSKYCGAFRSLRRWLCPQAADSHLELDDNSAGGQSRRHEAWHASPSNGLDDALISKISVHKYRRGDGVVQGTDCSVCLSEFREDDSLRLLPKCRHVFHLQCIDTWLRSHSNCPLCRTNIVSVSPVSTPPQAAPEPVNSPQVEEASRRDEIVIVIEDMVACSEEETEIGSNGDAEKEQSRNMGEIGDDDVQPVRRSFSMDSSDRGRVSIADVLQMSMEDELLAAKQNGFWVGSSSSRRAAGDHGKVISGRSRGRSRGLRGVMSPVPMKRSFSNGRFCLTRHGKGRNQLPLREASE